MQDDDACKRSTEEADACKRSTVCSEGANIDIALIYSLNDTQKINEDHATFLLQNNVYIRLSTYNIGI